MTALKADGGEDCKGRFSPSCRSCASGAQDMSVHRLLWHLYNRLQRAGSLRRHGRRRGAAGESDRPLRARPDALRPRGYRGLFAFVTQLRRLLEAGREPETVDPPAPRGGVRLMSIHKSKGLEFPIVILADLSKKFTRQDFQTPVLVHPDLGLGPVRVDLDRRIQYPTVARNAMEQVLRRESRSEELRILYVAMTRPRRS